MEISRVTSVLEDELAILHMNAICLGRVCAAAVAVASSQASNLFISMS